MAYQTVHLKHSFLHPVAVSNVCMPSFILTYFINSFRIIFAHVFILQLFIESGMVLYILILVSLFSLISSKILLWSF